MTQAPGQRPAPRSARRPRARRWRATAVATGALLAALIAEPLPPAGAVADHTPHKDPHTAAATYTNPVTAGVVDTFPDPSILRGKDGYWYAYGTQNPVFQSSGEDGEHILPILRSADMVHWTYAGDVFTPQTEPAWENGSRLWAPDIRYTDGHYNLFYAVSAQNTFAVATAPTPTGPWTDQGAVLPSPSGCPTNNIDEAQFTDQGGTPYMYWGSYDTLCVAQMNGDRTRTVGAVTQVARGRRMEGAFVVRRGDFYYLFYSDAGCCDGAYSGYQVKVGRATSPTGPFTDAQGVDLMELTSKGSVVAGANGNRWIGPGHNAIQTDLSGQDWLVYHAIPSDDPDLKPASGGTLKLSRRPMLIDRLDWIDGWPVLRAGAGPSDTPQTAPVASWTAGGTFNDGSLSGWHTAGAHAAPWTLATGQDTGPYAVHTGGASTPAFLVTDGRAPADLRAEADLRVTSTGGRAGLVVDYRNPSNYVVAWLDHDRNALVTDVVEDGRSAGEQSTPLPGGFQWEAWRNVAVEIRGTRMTTEVSADRLGDAVATQTRDLPASAARAGAVGTAALGGETAADNVGAAALYTPVTTRVPEPRPGALLPAYSDDFDTATVPGTTADSPWTWVRGPASGVAVTGSALSWPTQGAELYTNTNTASVLTRPAPSGDYTVETKIEFAPAKSNQQAGIALYENDDRYFKLAHSVLPLNNGGGALLNVTEFGKEGERPTTTPPTAVAYAPMFGGPTADTMWMRLRYHADTVHNESEVTASTSRDGRSWVSSGTWTLPRQGPLRIALFSMNTAGAVAQFDYVHTYGG
ncbi:family 43 glycosylhydrolase [Peterkaempfera sp. SMS 1(5)a]|uniref:family 43 glycosylhydrolase n=1 Tax=Peterkaempfera podocarpi TaxID=3232308 RepID=UPI003672708E